VENDSGEQREKVTLRREKGVLHNYEKAVTLSSKRRKTNKKNSWVHKDLRKSIKKVL